MSSAQAAALAAFSASKSTSNQKKPPALKLGSDINNFVKKSPPSRVQTPVPTPGKKAGAIVGQIATPRAAVPAQTPTFGAVAAQSGRSSNIVSNTPSSRGSAGSVVGNSSRGTPGVLNARTPRNPREKSGSRASFSGNNGPQSSSPVDYFSLPRLTSKSSPELDKTRDGGYILASSGTDTSSLLKRSVSTSTKPQDMLDSVRASIQSKSKTGTGKEARQKGQAAVDEFRQSVDSRRLMSQANQVGTACNEKRSSIDRASLSSHHTFSREELFREPLSARSSRQSSSSDSIHRIARLNIGSNNVSQSSLPSVVSDANDSGDAESGPQIGPNFRISFYDSHSEENVAKKPTLSIPPNVKDPHDKSGPSTRDITPENAPSPIPIPLSSQGVDRGLAVTSSDHIPRGSLSAPTIGSLGTEIGYDSGEGATKPGRKKPPVDFFDMQSSRTSTSDVESSGPGISESSDIDTDDTEGGMKFPLFPGISDKHHHHRIGLFSKGKKKRDRGVVYDPESSSQPDENENENDAEKTLGPNAVREVKKAAVAAKSQTQPVKLKTTMRKESARKERKTAFNEDKPWKNHHGDLDAISDAQRKRYEGLWVSNKGLYLDHVATILVGVNEEDTPDTTLSKSMRGLSEQEISQRAAKLSASLNVDFAQPDLKELHGLESVQKQNLIHGSVVKKLWARSNLPRETLHSIWELVDFRKDATLSRAEFIVGMWLVDQCLYGRKLPKAVSKSVWSSLGGLGVSVSVKKKRR